MAQSDFFSVNSPHFQVPAAYLVCAMLLLPIRMMPNTTKISCEMKIKQSQNICPAPFHPKRDAATRFTGYSLSHTLIYIERRTERSSVLAEVQLRKRERGLIITVLQPT